MFRSNGVEGDGPVAEDDLGSLVVEKMTGGHHQRYGFEGGVGEDGKEDVVVEGWKRRGGRRL